MPFDPVACAPLTSDSVALFAGSLDLLPASATNLPSYIVGFQVTGGSQFIQAPVVHNPLGPIEPANRSRPILNRIVLSYRARYASGKPVTGLDLRSVELPRVIPFSMAGTALGFVELISPTLAEQLIDPEKVDPEQFSEAKPIELSVAVDIQGYMSGDRAFISTGPLTFPISVYRSSPSECQFGVRKPLPGACLYLGQGGSTFRAEVCCPNPMATDAGVGSGCGS